MSKRNRVWVRMVGGTACAAALLSFNASWASAHVEMEAESAAAGSEALLLFSVAHGCDGSPTTEMKIKLPEGINDASPTVNPGWTVKKVMQKLPAPVTDDHGNKVTTRVDQVVYTAKQSLPEGYRDVFAVQVALPENAAGKTLNFPTVQTCEKGDTAWVQIPAAGEDPEELEAPAPSVTVTAASEGADDHGGSPAEGSASPSTAVTPVAPPAESASTAATSSAGGSSWMGVTGLVAGLSGLAAGLTALVRGAKRP